MLKEKLHTLLEGLGVSVGTLAAYAGTDMTNISRIKSGARVPKANSKTIDKLLDGILRYAEEEEKTALLNALTDYRGGSRREALRGWLYPAAEAPSAEFASFAGKLGAVMQLANVSGKQLAKLTNTDASYISRIKSGSRTPKSNPAIYEAISRTLFDAVTQSGKLKELQKLIRSDRNTEDADFYFEYRNWLCDFVTKDTRIQTLLHSIDEIQPQSAQPYDVEQLDFSYRCREVYFDNAGLQEASLRFLSEVISSGAKEILLYSDRSIDWMTKDREFAFKWSVLMRRVVAKGVRIKIIHNIDRNIDDMVNAIQAWLPIYMSCSIEPYYSNTVKGKRFSHTLFLCPGIACVSAFNLMDDKHAMYNYYTDREHLEYSVYLYEGMLKKSMPLVHMEQRTEAPAGTSRIYHSEFSNIAIETDAVSVTVTRITEPKVSFVILNPPLCDAIRAYCNGE